MEGKCIGPSITKCLNIFPFGDDNAIILNSEEELQISVHRRDKLKAVMRRKPITTTTHSKA
jgi:hypothetical protein